MEEIKEWAEHPITKLLDGCIENYIEELRYASGDSYAPFEPQRTQEIMANLNGSIDTLEYFREALQGDWSMFEAEEVEIDEDGEPIRD